MANHDTAKMKNPLNMSWEQCFSTVIESNCFLNVSLVHLKESMFDLGICCVKVNEGWNTFLKI